MYSSKEYFNLKNKIAVVTGGAGILGKSICEALAKTGLKIAILDIDGKMAEQTAMTISDKTGTKVIGINANVLEKDSLIEAKKIINNILGPVDILINGAGGNAKKATTKAESITEENLNKLDETFLGLDIDAFKSTFDLNFIGTLLPSMIFSTDMIIKKEGVILNISSMSAFHPLTKVPAYSAAKSSVNNFTEWLAVHLAKVGIRVNAIAPGFFLTSQNRFLLTDEKTDKLTPRGEKIIKNTPMERFGNPEDLHGTVIYLISEMAEFVTGVVIPIDGGFNAFSGV
ncbi:SDR family oxidoreductase [Bacteroidota bacterium]